MNFVLALPIMNKLQMNKEKFYCILGNRPSSSLGFSSRRVRSYFLSYLLFIYVLNLFGFNELCTNCLCKTIHFMLTFILILYVKYEGHLVFHIPSKACQQTALKIN